MLGSERSLAGEPDQDGHRDAAESSRWVDVALGQNHTCGLDDGGVVWCWGDDGYGQLGSSPIGCGDTVVSPTENCDDGNTANFDGCNARCSGAADPLDAVAPTQLPGDRRYRRLFASEFQTCAIAMDDTLWCWGHNAESDLGVGDLIDRGAPTQVLIVEASGRDAMWSAVSLGDGHGCGVHRDGSLWCWGSNAAGALGLGGGPDRQRPEQVAPANVWRAVDAGGQYTCALDDAAALWCWGDNSQNQLGLADGLPRDPPAMIDAGPWASFGGGHYHACAVRPDGSAACWGDNDAGEVGVGVRSPAEPTPANIVNRWSEVTGGDAFTCGIERDGSGWCWGDGLSGRLGNGSEADSPAPIRTF